MRLALLLCLALGAAAADREVFVLTDGRELTGVYDEAAGKLTLDGPAKAVLPVKPDQIASRKPAPPAAEASPAPADPAAAKAVTPEQKTAAARALVLQRQLDELDGAAAKADRDAAAARKDAARKREEMKVQADQYRRRAKAEGKKVGEWTAENRESTTGTGASNKLVLDAKAEAERLDQKAAELDALARSKRAGAAALRGDAAPAAEPGAKPADR